MFSYNIITIRIGGIFVYYVFCGIYFFFALYGVVCCTVNLWRWIMHCDVDRKIVVISVCEDDAEYSVRCAMTEYPDSEIEVVNKTLSAECSAILAALARDYERVHII